MTGHSQTGPEVILIVEDNLGTRTLLTRLVAHFCPGFAVTAYGSAREALDFAAQTTPRLVITDLDMPEMDGYTLINQLASNPATAAVPIIITTSTADRTDDHLIQLELEKRGLPTCAITAKPIDIVDFEERLTALLGAAT